MRKKLILDLDTGIDDALAIAYALGSADEIDLIGITATYGNVAVPLAARNALAVLHLFGRDDVPVYPGVDHPIAPATLPKMRGTTPDERAQAYARWQNGGADGWQTDASWSPTPGSVAVHHPNGIGGAIIPDSPRAPEAPGSAVDFIITAAREYGPDLTIVPTGAMTTMATVFRNAPDLKDSGVNVTLMGGALTLPGNVSPAAEANISQDPEAADYLFKCGARTTMIGLDVTHQTALTREKAHEWASLGTPAGDFLVTMTDYYIDFYLKNQPEIRGCGLHDPLAVAAALDPSLVTTFGFNLQVDLEVAALPGVTTWACSPVDGTVVCAVKTSPQRAQWLPSVKPSETHVGGTAASVTTSWPNASSSPARFVRPQCRHVRFVKPASVQVGSVVAEM